MGAGRLPFWVILINKSAFQKKVHVTVHDTHNDEHNLLHCIMHSA